jgi:sortase (surface protein transpeptidase)
MTPVIPISKSSTFTPTAEPTPSISILGASYDSSLDIYAGPVELPLVLQIPAIEVEAPILGVGQSEDNAMDSPKGPWGDPVWSSAFWYRGSAIPGEPGTATITGHVNGMLGEPQTFAKLKKLLPGDLIIIHVNNTLIDIHFIVDEVKRYSIQESSDPEVLNRIYGLGPTSGTAAQAGTDGLAHLTLITCTGYYVDGQFDHHIVVYATRSN